MEPKIMALNKNKTDAKLGQEISRHLYELGVETPLMTNEGILDLKDSSQIELITNDFTHIMETMGLDLSEFFAYLDSAIEKIDELKASDLPI